MDVGLFMHEYNICLFIRYILLEVFLCVKMRCWNITVRRLHHTSVHIHSHIGVQKLNSVIRVYVYIGDKLAMYI